MVTVVLHVWLAIIMVITRVYTKHNVIWHVSAGPVNQPLVCLTVICQKLKCWLSTASTDDPDVAVCRGFLGVCLNLWYKVMRAMLHSPARHSWLLNFLSSTIESVEANCLWRDVLVMPEPMLPFMSQPWCVAVFSLVPNYTGWWQRHIVWTVYPRLLCEVEQPRVETATCW